VIDDEQKFDVEDIVDSRVVERTLNRRLQYKIRWVEHSSDRKWYSIENFDHAKKIVVDFHQRYFDKSKSHFLITQSLFISSMTHLINSFNWVKKSIQKTKSMIENILNKMKKEMKFNVIKQSSISNVERNNINSVWPKDFINLRKPDRIELVWVTWLTSLHIDHTSDSNETSYLIQSVDYIYTVYWLGSYHHRRDESSLISACTDQKTIIYYYEERIWLTISSFESQSVITSWWNQIRFT
jgi:hypothetical protein